MEFMNRLKELRSSKNLTQLELANQIGFSMSIVNKWENGKKLPSTQAIMALAKYFKETTDYILGLQE